MSTQKMRKMYGSSKVEKTCHKSNVVRTLFSMRIDILAPQIEINLTVSEISTSRNDQYIKKKDVMISIKIKYKSMNTSVTHPNIVELGLSLNSV